MSARRPKRQATKGTCELSAGINATFDALTAGYCIVECAMRSLEFKDAAHPEGEALKAALEHIWRVHEWLSERVTDVDDDEEADL